MFLTLILKVLCLFFLYVQISYTVDPALSSKYHAHADGSLLVLLDVTPSQEMVDEGIAREVINKIQKLRKKVNVRYMYTMNGLRRKMLIKWIRLSKVAMLLHSSKKAMHVVGASIMNCWLCCRSSFSFKETTSEFVAVVLIAASLYRASISRLASYTGY